MATHDMYDYPLLRYSHIYTNAIKFPFNEVAKPDELAEPPIEPAIEDYRASTLGSIGWIISFLGMFILLSSDAANLSRATLFILVFTLEIAPIFLFQWLANNENTNAYSEALQNHHKKKIAWVHDETKYNKQLQLYREYNNMIQNHAENNYKLADEAKGNVIMKLFLSRVSKPVVKAGQRKGVSELSFTRTLIQSMPKGYEISSTMLLEYGEEQGYYPDICCFSKSSDIYIDIEIDEPYVLDSHLPIHHINSNDNNRDSFFQSSGWHVVRFAEVQIVAYPGECVNFIVSVINNLNKYKLETPNFTGEYCKKWDADQAKRMAKLKLREEYLIINNVK